MVSRTGTDGRDRFDDGTDGDDDFRGLGDRDVFFVSDGNDTFDGGDGIDVAAYQFRPYPGGVYINNTAQARDGVAPFSVDKRGFGTDTLIDIEELNGSIGPDVIYFWYSGAQVWSSLGNDLLVAPQREEASPSNWLLPSEGDDTIIGADAGDGLSYFHFTDSRESTPDRGVEVDLETGRAIDGWGGTDEFSGIARVEGWNLNDRISGDGARNFLYGLGGNDILEGRGGDDYLEGGEGADTLIGGDGDDDRAGYYEAQSGIVADLPAGTVEDGTGSTDRIEGIEGIEGSDHDDRIFGDDLDNWFFGLDGNDLLEGRGGDDFLRGYAGADTLNGGEGDDEVYYGGATSGVVVDLRDGTASDGRGSADTLISIERVEGSDHDDRLFGSDENNWIVGRAGDDLLEGRDGGDSFEPGPGNDTIVGGASGPDPYLTEVDADVVGYWFEEGAIKVVFSARYEGTVLEDWSQIEGGETWSTTDTFRGIDVVSGSDFGDYFLGAAGRQSFYGRAGNDTFDGAEGNDIVAYAREDEGAVTVDLATGSATDEFGDTDTLISIEEVRGTNLNDWLKGDDGANTLRGGDGDDTLTGGGGSDLLVGGDGFADRVVLDGGIGDYIFEIDAQTGELRVSDKGAAGVPALTVSGVEQFELADGYAFDAEGYVNATSLGGVIAISVEELLTFVEMYVAYFDRAPDALGLFYWGSRLADGMGLGEIAQSFFFQDETFALYPELEGRTSVDDPSSLSSEFYGRLVDDTYDKLLERTPDAEGRAFWIGELESGEVRLGEFVLAVINGAKAFNPDGATPEQVAQAAADARTVEEKGQLGYAFAVEGGMNDLDNARDVMGTYDLADRTGSISAAEALITEYRAAAEAADSTEIVVQIANLGDDPMAIA